MRFLVIALLACACGREKPPAPVVSDEPGGHMVSGMVYFERQTPDGGWEPAHTVDAKGARPWKGQKAQGVWYLPPGHAYRIRVP